jgi:hypothetical protein
MPPRVMPSNAKNPARARRNRVQPYARGRSRPQGRVLAAQKKGRTAFGYNPQDSKRRVGRKRRPKRNPLYRYFGV